MSSGRCPLGHPHPQRHSHVVWDGWRTGDANVEVCCGCSPYLLPSGLQIAVAGPNSLLALITNSVNWEDLPQEMYQTFQNPGWIPTSSFSAGSACANPVLVFSVQQLRPFLWFTSFHKTPQVLSLAICPFDTTFRKAMKVKVPMCLSKASQNITADLLNASSAH